MQRARIRRPSVDEPSPQPLSQRDRTREIAAGVSLAGVYGDDEQGEFGETRGLKASEGGCELWICSKVYSRADVARRHTKKCKVANGVAGRGEQSRW